VIILTSTFFKNSSVETTKKSEIVTISNPRRVDFLLEEEGVGREKNIHFTECAKFMASLIDNLDEKKLSGMTKRHCLKKE